MNYKYQKVMQGSKLTVALVAIATWFYQSLLRQNSASKNLLPHNRLKKYNNRVICCLLEYSHFVSHDKSRDVTSMVGITSGLCIVL